jgi:hypothetical protein
MKKNTAVQIGAIIFLITLLMCVSLSTLLSLKASSKKPTTIEALSSWWLLGALHSADAQVFGRVVDITDDHRSYTIEDDLYTLLNERFRVFIGALPGAMISDQLVISRALFSNSYKPKLVAITFSPRDFIDRYFPSKISTEAFVFFSKYNDSSSLRNDLDKLYLEKYKSNAMHDNTNESSLHLGRPFQLLAPEEIIIYSGDDYSHKDDTEEYKERYKNPLSPQLDMQLGCLDSLLKYLVQRHIAVIVFNLPISQSNRKLLPNEFWTYYNERINKICRKHGADYISADRVVLPFEETEFADGIHLNLIGGHRWSRPVAFYIANRFHSKPFQQLLSQANKCLK